MAAVLFKVDWAWKSGITNKACTSRPCNWNEYGARGKVLDLQPVSELEWKKPHYKKGGNTHVFIAGFHEHLLYCSYKGMY